MALQFACSSCHEMFPVELEETGAEKPCPRCGTTVALPAHPLSGGYSLGDWMVCGSLGVGRNGSIYQAQHIKTHTLAALRVPEDDLIGGPEDVDAFCGRVSRLQGLKHPSIAQILFSGSIGDVCFYGMEFCDGGCLPILLRHGRLDEDDAWRILAQLADGLAYLHRQGFFPSDLEPSKVVFDHDGNAKWSDFVLARPLRVNDGPSRPPGFGTPCYASPEQLRGGVADARSNLYSLGAIAFEMLTGQPPFAKATGAATLDAQLHESAPDASTLAPVSHWTAVLVQRLLARDPSERFQNADHLVDALRASPPPPAPPRRVRASIVKLATAPPQEGGGPTPDVRTPRIRQPRPKVAGSLPKTAPRPAAKPRQSHAPLIAFASLLVAVLLVAGLIGWRILRQQRLQREYDAEVAAERSAERARAARPMPDEKAAPARTLVDAPDAITLLAASAALHGKTLKRGVDNSSIGWWSTPDQWVEWKFANDKAGKYAVVAELSATASGKFEIVAGDKKLRCSSPKTGHYNKFQTVTLGTIELAAGDIALAVKPLKQGWKPMNLKAIRLKASE